ncbi:MAG: UvrD-helicase domain-containing protein [Bacilli bacterium]|nr:UvrD-helicase domain-containing protein [Bacilli bacterium]
MLTEYCAKKGTSPSEVDELMSFFINDIVRSEHNKTFCQKEVSDNKEYFDHILDAFDPKIRLDSDQLRTVVGDEDNTLVIAGAGAGKTTTVAAKVKYLVDKKNIAPDEILVISFTNKAVDELKERINKKLKIKCDISTFHSVGSSIIYKKEDKKTVVKEEQFLFNSIRDYLRGKILTDKNMTSKIILFFASYLELPPRFDTPLDEFFSYVSKKDFCTMRSELKEQADEISDTRSSHNKTIKNETVASYQELQIANFLFINGIDYIYEDPYKYQIKGSHKIYTPDFHIFQDDKDAYLEHFGMVSDTGTNNTRGKEEIDRYIKAIRDKVALHNQHNTTLLRTFGAYSDGEDVIFHLRKELLAHGFELREKTQEEIYNTVLLSESNKYINRLVFFIKDFISAFKTNGYTSGYFKTLRNKTKNERDKIFLDICEGAYNNYQNDLKINNSIDFSDMINDSVEIIREMERNHEYLKYKYIIVDEYQDISHQRFNLTDELSRICKAKIVAVGDDWQSIYAFSGSDITLFTEFKKNIRDQNLGCELLYINNTYRNAQELIDIAGRFILKNQTQFTKQLKSPKTMKNPVVIYSYCDDEKKIKEQDLRNSLFQKANALEKVLDQLVADDPSILNRDSGKEPILLIGRYGFDVERLSVGKRDADTTFDDLGDENNEEYNIFDYNEKEKRLISKKYPTLRMAFLTAHSSKGLTYDNVIIINGMNDLYGFPSKKEDDPIMDLVIRRDKSMEYAEERRLFYVALTRTSNKVYILAPETRPSEFVAELITDKGFKNILVKGVFNETLRKKHVYYCPDCGFPLKRRKNNAVGIPLYICTNEHELCGFMTNDIKGGRLRVLKCNSCLDGYLIVKKKPEDDTRFLGCTNYKPDGTGCNETISIQQFNALYPQGETSKRRLEEVVNRNPLKYEGSSAVSLNTNVAIEKAKQLKEDSKQEKPKSGNVYQMLLEHCQKYQKRIRFVDTSRCFAFIKNGKSWHWFGINKKTKTFFYRDTFNSEKHNYSLYEISFKDICLIIDRLMSQEKSENKSKKEGTTQTPSDEAIKKTDLFKRLKSVRLEIANMEQVPAYVILHDSTLINICKVKPTNLDELSRCKGMTPNKLDKYGIKILNVLKIETNK